MADTSAQPAQVGAANLALTGEMPIDQSEDRDLLSPAQAAEEDLDLLVYAHDGRGLGHVSRSVAIALAARRLDPMLRVLVVTGSRHVADLCGGASLDWVKLPSYETRFLAGESYGRPGRSNLSDAGIVELRRSLLNALVASTRPRCVLVDHLPTGKRNELQQALFASSAQTAWVLGMRAITGDVSGVWGRSGQSAFERHFTSLIWYGSASVTGPEMLERLHGWSRAEPVEAGYVSRARELECAGLLKRSQGPRDGVVVAVTWRDEATMPLLGHLADVASIVGDEWGEWQVFLPEGGGDEQERVTAALARAGATVAPLTGRYLTALQRARVAVVHGGYNTLTDLTWAGTPGVVVVRRTKDREQLLHSVAFAQASGGMIVVEPDAWQNVQVWLKLLEDAAGLPFSSQAIPLTGAAVAAEHVIGVAQVSSPPAQHVAGSDRSPPRA